MNCCDWSQHQTIFQLLQYILAMPFGLCEPLCGSPLLCTIIVVFTLVCTIIVGVVVLGSAQTEIIQQ